MNRENTEESCMLFVVVIMVVDVFTFAVPGLSNITIAVTNDTPSNKAPSSLAKSDYQMCATNMQPIAMLKTARFPCAPRNAFGRYLFIIGYGSNESLLQLCEVKVYVDKRKLHLEQTSTPSTDLFLYIDARIHSRIKSYLYNNK